MGDSNNTPGITNSTRRRLLCDASIEDLEAELQRRKSGTSERDLDHRWPQHGAEKEEIRSVPFTLKSQKKRKQNTDNASVQKNRCLDRSTCLCLVSKYKQICRECLGDIFVGDCVKLNGSEGRFGFVHVQCPGLENPLIEGLCEKQSKCGKCKCAKAQYHSGN